VGGGVELGGGGGGGVPTKQYDSETVLSSAGYDGINALRCLLRLMVSHECTSCNGQLRVFGVRW